MRPVQRRFAGITATALSVALHATLILTAAMSIFPGAEPPKWIRVSLLAGGGGGGEARQPEASVPSAPDNKAATSTRAGATIATTGPEPKPAARGKRRPPAVRKNQRHGLPGSPPPPPGAAIEAPAGPVAAAASGGHAVGSVGGDRATGFGSGPGRGGGFGSSDGGRGDLRALCVRCPKPQYPRLARLRGWEGTVDVEVALGVDGKVSSASIASSSGFAVLDDAALAAARQSRFQLSGARVLRGRIAYGFRLSAAAAR